ncbi:MAG: hypothetical protein OEW67_14935, partial [Cyclobacteriaceae bacterium]|nr:hypothetical protein [Cyclobacteriaceae bacterium]
MKSQLSLLVSLFLLWSQNEEKTIKALHSIKEDLVIDTAKLTKVIDQFEIWIKYGNRFLSNKPLQEKDSLGRYINYAFRSYRS